METEETDALAQEPAERIEPSDEFSSGAGEHLWSIEFADPIPLDLPEADQVEAIVLRGVIGEANEAFASAHGAAVSDIVGLPLDRFMLRSIHTTIPLFQDLVRSGYRLVDVETAKPAAKGLRLSMLHSIIGTIVDNHVASLSCTARELAEKRQVEQEIKLQTVAIEAMSDGCVIVDASVDDMPIVYANTRFSDITGYPRSETLGRNCRFLQGPKTSRTTLSLIRSAIDNGMPFRGELLNYRRNGDSFWNFLRLTPVSGDDGSLTHYVGVLTDITEQKWAETKVHDLAARLISVQEKDKLHISRELHDDFTQRLAALAMDTGNVADSVEEAPDRAREELTRIRRGLSDLAIATQEFSRQLHPQILEELGLAHAVHSACRRFSKRTGLEVDLALDCKTKLTQEGALCLYRILQEGLSNAYRHAKASHIEIELSETADTVILAIKDDGEGFDRDAARSGPSLGLVSMTERTRLCSGDLEIKTAPGQGTSITATIPISMNTEK